MDVKEHT